MSKLKIGNVHAEVDLLDDCTGQTECWVTLNLKSGECLAGGSLAYVEAMGGFELDDGSLRVVGDETLAKIEKWAGKQGY
jgi:hypothetical protein|tara:strand:+ start:54 stop:290 length:237 start_codon:yes stop_codon:yes gene_type:complete